MSWSRRKFLVLIPLALGACGFQPVYGPGGTGSALYGQVAVSEPDSVESYALVQNLEQRLGRAGSAAYSLDVDIETATQGQAITASNETTRYSIVGEASYTLTRLSDGTVVASGDVENFTGYSATGSTVETLAGERDARERLMSMLADQITTRLLTTTDLPA
ncbi:LPS assembly lipoprotein LptE [Lutimaribacter marinistellae]|uniref:LPS assembly lipoprotein LptE n=1 Tax=Lutimaribacter marinistellae TaxID=1820329 RepID=A0ABV7TC58_9RHOB